MSSVFMDTSFVIAVENLRDPYHVRAKELDQQLSSRRIPYLLHWGIIFEVGDGYARLGRRQRGVELLDNFSRHNRFQVVPVDDDLLAKAIALFRDRPDKEWGLIDCVSFALMERKGIDPHFRQAGFVPLLLESEAST